MSRHSTPKTPTEAYQALVDDLVTQTRRSWHARLIASEGVYSRGPGDADANAFVGSLSEADRSVLAQLVAYERDSAIHDVLVVLNDWVASRGLQLVFQGQPLPSDLGGGTLYHDYVGRCDGWEWPKNNPPTE